jgi:hypothetical protein
MTRCQRHMGKCHSEAPITLIAGQGTHRISNAWMQDQIHIDIDTKKLLRTMPHGSSTGYA